MKVTFRIDDEILARARKLASRRGTSVNQLILRYLEEFVGDLTPDEMLAELSDLWKSGGGNSGGLASTREALHER